MKNKPAEPVAEPAEEKPVVEVVKVICCHPGCKKVALWKFDEKNVCDEHLHAEQVAFRESLAKKPAPQVPAAGN